MNRVNRVDLTNRAILEYAGRGQLTLSPAGLITHRGDAIDDQSALQVIGLLDDGVLVELEGRIVPASASAMTVDAFIAKYLDPAVA